MRTFALIPAAGKSTRMGWPKLSLPLGDATVLERVIAALKTGGIGSVVVVIGPHVAELVELAERAGAMPCLLDRETADMRETIERGLQFLERSFSPTEEDAWLLVPADHPLLAPAVIPPLLASYVPGGIVVPVCGGKRGHPTLIAWSHVAGIRAMPAGQGINLYLRTQRESTVEVEVGLPEILNDLDTPEDYERLRSLPV